MPQLVRRLKQFLGADETAAAASLPHFPQNQLQCPRKHQSWASCSTKWFGGRQDLQPREEKDSAAGVQFAFEDYSFQQEGQLIGLFHGGLLHWRSDTAAVTWRRHCKPHGKSHFLAKWQWAANIQVASMDRQVQNHMLKLCLQKTLFCSPPHHQAEPSL